MLAKTTTGTKILASFGLAIAISTLGGIAAFVSMETVKDRLTDLADQKFATAQALADMREAMTLAARGNATLQLRRAEEEMRLAGRGDVESAVKRIDADVKAFGQIPHGERTAELWQSAQQPLTAWRQATEEVLRIGAERDRLLSQGVDPGDARLKQIDAQNWAQFHEVGKHFQRAGPAIMAVVESNAKSVEAAKQAGHDSARTGVAVIVASILVGAVLLLATGVILSRSIGAVIRDLLNEAGTLQRAVQAGKLGERGDLDAMSFEFRPVVEGINQIMDAFVGPIQLTAEYVDRISKGDLPPKIADAYQGDFDAIKQNLNRCVDAVGALVQDAKALSQSAVEGKLATRADASRHRGDFQRIVAGVNATLDAITGPIDEATQVLEKLAERDLRARMKGSYQGDYARIKEALNGTAQALHDSLAQVARSVDQVSSASEEIASSSQSVASGASEQASALEETSSNLETMSSMTKQAADNAQQAAALAATARSAASDGSAAMEQMTGAMGKIKASSEGTSEIIKDINEIAFQTNLLALNAAVEAARAGEAGRGFAVVAEEVRSLALRSKEAANKTEALIRQSVKEAGEGEVTAKHVNEKLSEIVGSVSKVTEIVAEIAASSKEQAAGIEQVNKAVAEMDKVTQQNAASSEESSSAATELAGQSQELATMIGSFRLEHGGAAAAPRQRARSAPALPTTPSKRGKNGLAPRPAAVIPMDGEFVPGEF